MAVTGSIPVNVTLTPNVKPGVRTTEFWTTMLTHLVAGLVLLVTLVLHRSFVNQDSVNALIPIGASVAAGVSQIVYVLGRTKLKTAAHVATTSQAVNIVQSVDPSLAADVSQVVASLRTITNRLPQAVTSTVAASLPLGGIVTPPAVGEGTAEAGAPAGV